jgi:hypothetical protein
VSQSEYPTTDVDEIKGMLKEIRDEQIALNGRLDRQAEGINGIGGNLNWLVQNTQGIFQMFASPQFISQMSNMIAGGMTNAGQNPGPGPDPDAGPEPG